MTNSHRMRAWRGRRPLTWEDFLMNPIGVGMNYLTMPDIKDVRKKELAEGGLVSLRKILENIMINSGVFHQLQVKLLKKLLIMLQSN